MVNDVFHVRKPMGRNFVFRICTSKPKSIFNQSIPFKLIQSFYRILIGNLVSRAMMIAASWCASESGSDNGMADYGGLLFYNPAQHGAGSWGAWVTAAVYKAYEVRHIHSNGAARQSRHAAFPLAFHSYSFRITADQILSESSLTAAPTAMSLIERWQLASETLQQQERRAIIMLLTRGGSRNLR